MQTTARLPEIFRIWPGSVEKISAPAEPKTSTDAAVERKLSAPVYGRRWRGFRLARRVVHPQMPRMTMGVVART